MTDHKSSVRARVFSELRQVAFPDSRFHFDFGEFITDFIGSDAAVARLTAHAHYRDARTIFITPDNCIEQLRYQALRDGKRVLTTSYSIKRGFWLLEPEKIKPERYLYASTLDGMEREARPLTLRQIAVEIGAVDYLVTGTGAINERGVRFGKGHGFFDAEWAMLYRMGVIHAGTPAAAVVHDCQVLQEELFPEIFDTVADVIFTPGRTIVVDNPHKPECGIVWDLLDAHMFETIPPLQELKEIEAAMTAKGA
jgi:5-formyltetrahydrofolate cyclo-ligase